MEQNRPQYNLRDMFAMVAIEGITDANKVYIETFLIDVLDRRDMIDTFSSPLFFNFILLLKNQGESTFLLNHLIQEVELKSLRLTYMSLLSTNGAQSSASAPNQNRNQNNCCNGQNQNNKDCRPDNRFEGINQFNVSPLSKILEAADKRD